MTITCKYSCNDCGIYRQTVEVKAREAESVIDWMEKVCIPTLVRDHESRSPVCHPKTLTELMIPTPAGTTKVGGPVEN